MTQQHPLPRQTPQEQQQKRRRWRGGLDAINTERPASRGLTLTGSLGTLLAVLLWWVFQHQAPTQPALAGMSRIATEAQLQHSGLNKRITYGTALDQQADTARRPDPAAGTKLDHNSGVSVALLATSESSPALQPWSTPMLSIGAGLLIAVVTVPVGVSGAVFLLPVQLSVLGVPSPAVTPTNLLFNLVAVPGALLHYRKRGQLGGLLVARHGHGTTVSGFLPRGWDHPVASDGTTRRVAPWGLITSDIRSVHVMRRGGSVDGVSGGLGD